MSKVWKIGSRWNESGGPHASILSIFRRSGVVFIGNERSEVFNSLVHTGDYFAISDGFRIVSVARATSEPMNLNEMISKNVIRIRKNKDSGYFNITDNFHECYGVKAKIVDLPLESQFDYKCRQAFVNIAINDIREKVIRLYDEYLNNCFNIQSITSRIKKTRKQNDGKSSLLDGKTSYVIPVYQREYSWGKTEIYRFITDIFRGFWGSEDKHSLICEPLFIGTMQLSYRKHISSIEVEQEVIDGQQRLSTILCFLKYLKLRYPDQNSLYEVELDWLETRVNNFKEQSYIDEMLAIDSIDKIRLEYINNRYIENLAYIQDCYNDMVNDENGRPDEFFSANIDSFIEYFLNDIYFVVVETVAGLSKTIQIFNTINTAGLDLNGDDLFKVRLYEYLHDVKGFGEEAFDEINALYKRVKDTNTTWRKEHNYDIIHISQVRQIYQQYLISKYDLNANLYEMNTDRFFDELFDVLLNVMPHKDMKNINGLELSLEELNRIIDCIYFWEKYGNFRNSNDLITYKIILDSRYSKYVNSIYLLLLSTEDKTSSERINIAYCYVNLISRLFFCWSIFYAKAVYEIHSVMHKVMKALANKDFQHTKSLITEKLISVTPEYLSNEIGKNIIDKPCWKSLICTLSEYFEEIDCGKSLKDVSSLLFDGCNYDIEHIHANANDSECTDIDYDLQNSIGNLMLLEYDINRSIGCLPFHEKKDRPNGMKSYKDSHLATVNRIMKYEEWTVKDIESRRDKEVKKICDFLLDF